MTALRCGLLGFLLLAGTWVQAQDVVRPSLAGEAAAEARRQSLDRIPYNLLVGPVRFRFSATAGLEYNDNINLAEVRTEEDFIFRPMVNLNALWPVTQLNTLRFDIGIGYSFYFEHTENNTDGLLLAPGSQLSFDIFVGDFRINFHDRFSLQQDPIDEPAISNTADYGRFENTAGVSVLWDLNQVVVTAGYDHYNFIAINERFSYLDRAADSFAASISVAVSSTTGAGLEGALVDTRYCEDVHNDNWTYSAGGFVETQITSYLKLRVAGGYQMIDFEDRDLFLIGPSGGFMRFRDDDMYEDFYFNALLSHRINAAITHRLAVGHEAELGVNSNYVTLDYIRHTATWNIINRTLLSTEIFYEEAEDSGGFVDERLHRYGGAITVGYQLTRHITLGARYQYIQKDSDVPFRDYKQNRFSIDGTYSF